jgi:HAD superfamily hydrolase (TIGR01509 family)
VLEIPPALVIFDCDGVLVDSEPIANRILAEALTAAGYPCSFEHSVAHFVGRSLASIVAAVESEMGRPLPDEFADRVQAKTFAAFRRELKPVPGIVPALARIDTAKCVASSGKPEKMRLTLGLTGLADYFGGHVFSAAMVARGKPAPDLFLYAARQMDAAPEACTVVEDSVAGATAARAAGMRTFGYAGGSHVLPDHARRLADAGAHVFDDMNDLPDLLNGKSRGP